MATTSSSVGYITIQVMVSSSRTGIIVTCYDVAALEAVSASYNTDSPLPAATPICTKVGMGSVIISTIRASKEQVMMRIIHRVYHRITAARVVNSIFLVMIRNLYWIVVLIHYMVHIWMISRMSFN